MSETLVRGRLYRLTREVRRENQGARIKYPRGLVLRLDFVEMKDDVRYSWVDTEEGRFTDCEVLGKVPVYHFTSHDGYCNVFAPADVEPVPPEVEAAATPADAPRVSLRYPEEAWPL